MATESAAPVLFEHPHASAGVVELAPPAVDQLDAELVDVVEHQAAEAEDSPVSGAAGSCQGGKSSGGDPGGVLELEDTAPVVVEILDAELAVVDEHQGVVDVVDVDARLSTAAAAAIADSVPASTRRAYAADRTAYAVWCAEVGRTAVPATAETLAEYVHHLTVTPRPRTGRPSSPASIARAMSSIGTWHEERGHGKPSTRGARAVLAGYRARLAEAKDPAAVQRKATPAVPTALRAMLATSTARRCSGSVTPPWC